MRPELHDAYELAYKTFPAYFLNFYLPFHVSSFRQDFTEESAFIFLKVRDAVEQASVDIPMRIDAKHLLAVNFIGMIVVPVYLANMEERPVESLLGLIAEDTQTIVAEARNIRNQREDPDERAHPISGADVIKAIGHVYDSLHVAVASIWSDDGR